jgi:hypothetical protein
VNSSYQYGAENEEEENDDDEKECMCALTPRAGPLS